MVWARASNGSGDEGDEPGEEPTAALLGERSVVVLRLGFGVATAAGHYPESRSRSAGAR